MARVLNSTTTANGEFPAKSDIPFSFFFFSSRRRHTRSLCDWSSDVCSSDLKPSREAYLDSLWTVGDKHYRARVSVDGLRRTTEAVLEEQVGVVGGKGKGHIIDRKSVV